MTEMADYTDAQVIAKYLEIRAHKDTIKEIHAAEMAPWNDALETLEAVMASRLIARDAQNVKTDAGTAYRSALMKPKVVDRDKFLAYVLEKGAWGLLNIAAPLLDPLKDFMDANNKALPPGIDVTTVINTNFRKA